MIFIRNRVEIISSKVKSAYVRVLFVRNSQMCDSLLNMSKQ